jgi:hypothetical protein
MYDPLRYINHLITYSYSVIIDNLSITFYVHERIQVVLFCSVQVRSTVRHTIQLQFDISANALEIRALQTPKCIV